MQDDLKKLKNAELDDDMLSDVVGGVRRSGSVSDNIAKDAKKAAGNFVDDIIDGIISNFK